MTKKNVIMLRGFLENIFCRKGKTGWQILKNHKVLLKDPVGSNKGSRLVMDPLGVSSCVSRVPWYAVCCLECKNIANIANFLCWANFPLSHLIKDSQTSVWWGLTGEAFSTCTAVHSGGVWCVITKSVTGLYMGYCRQGGHWCWWAPRRQHY